MGKAIGICVDNLRRWGMNPRIYVIALLVLMMEETMMIGAVRAFSYAVDIPVSTWIYPFLTGDWYVAMLEIFGAILLFCDAPFMNQGTPYLFVRSGRKAWFFGQVLYVAVASVLYQLYIAVSSLLLLAPHLLWTLDWGKVLGTLAQTYAGSSLGVVLSSSIVQQFTPVEAALIGFVLCWMVTVIFGMLIFTVNMARSRLCGPIFASILALLLPFSINASGKMMLYLSPGAWMSLALIDVTGASDYPPLTYVLLAGAGLIVALTAFSYWRYRKRPIETLSFL